MARVVVVTSPELAAGYRLAGAATRSVDDAREAGRVLRELGRSADVAVVAVHEPYLLAQDPATRRALEAQLYPVVVALPAGEPGGPGESRAERIAAMMRRAIGYHMSFAPEGEG